MSGKARSSGKVERIGIAMSGGVDSTACALKLIGTAHIEGFFMRLAQPDFAAQLSRVEELAEQLGIPLTVVDLREQFTTKVLDYFADSYIKGKTPNPCMVCNHEIKFGLFQEAILDHGMQAMATGHYARAIFDGNIYHLHDGFDPTKNQAYFLARLTQNQLSKVLFPLSNQTKKETYQFVKDNGFTGFDGIESQDICFLSEETVGHFLETNYPERLLSAGPIVSTDGRDLGQHRGLYHYTIGQRRGLGLPDSSPWYVTGIDGSANRLIVGKADELFAKEITLSDMHWVSGIQPDLDKPYTVRIRYSHRGSEARLIELGDRQFKLHFVEQQRAITPGQYAVIFDGDEVIGSGVILS